jgi:hypothetical protein
MVAVTLLTAVGRTQGQLRPEGGRPEAVTPQAGHAVLGGPPLIGDNRERGRRSRAR